MEKKDVASVEGIYVSAMERSVVIESAREIFEQIVGPVPEDRSAPKSSVPYWDSVRHAELVIKLMDRFETKIPVRMILGINSYQEMEEALVQLICNKK